LQDVEVSKPDEEGVDEVAVVVVEEEEPKVMVV
jgi:hypothetical protein